jgi:hypothetical protein
METKYNTKRCLMCDEVINITSGAQLYCSKCRKIKSVQNLRRNSRKYYYSHIKKEAERKHKWYVKNWARIRKHQKEYSLKKKLENEKLKVGKK